jgi:hypothetical protein
MVVKDFVAPSKSSISLLPLLPSEVLWVSAESQKYCLYAWRSRHAKLIVSEQSERTGEVDRSRRRTMAQKRRPEALASLQERLRIEAVLTLWAKAQQASWLAKLARGLPAIRALYRVKHRHISRAIELAPESIWLTDWSHGVIGVAVKGRPGALHIPLAELSPKAAGRMTELREVTVPRREARAQSAFRTYRTEKGGAA